MTPIVIPGVGETTVGAALGQVAAQAPGAVAGKPRLRTSVRRPARRIGGPADRTGCGAGQSDGDDGGRPGAEGPERAAVRAAGPACSRVPGRACRWACRWHPRSGSTLGQLPQQASQMVMQPMQQLTQPLQQVTSMFSQMGLGGDKFRQMGLIGASPLSNHPLAGGRRRRGSRIRAGGFAPRCRWDGGAHPADVEARRRRDRADGVAGVRGGGRRGGRDGSGSGTGRARAAAPGRWE